MFSRRKPVPVDMTVLVELYRENDKNGAHTQYGTIPMPPPTGEPVEVPKRNEKNLTTAWGGLLYRDYERFEKRNEDK